MRTDPSVNQQLNMVLKEALTLISQYFLHARMLGNWGFKSLEKAEYDASIRAMKHADEIMQRILFLDGLPNPQDLGKLLIGEDVPEVVKNDLLLETRFRDILAQAVAHCEEQKDFVSRHHLEEMQEHSEGHIDWLETQLSLIGALGLENYLETSI